MNRIQLLLILISLSSSSFSQVIGGRENSEATPKVAEATQLSGGGFVGDVNAMTGEFQASIPLGDVSTPAGLGFSLSLNHSSSFAFSTNQPMTTGIPYGDGWSPNIPTISIETDVFTKYGCTLIDDGGGSVNPSNSDLNFNDPEDQYSGKDEGDLYWFAPTISIPGIVSGRAVFKYVDVDDSRCLVFVLNKFETSVEIRFYGNSWTVKLADGTVYSFKTHLANYRAPNNQRILFYDQSTLNTPTEVNVNRDVVDFGYQSHAASVQNVVEPKQTHSVWHCDGIYNQNTPLQGVRFEYQTFGKFNYFQEFNQTRYQDVRTEVFNAPTDTDYSAYSDIILQKMYSYVMETPLDIVELEHKTDISLVDNNTVLDHSQSDVERKDSLYSCKIVKEWGVGAENFDDWHRAKHWATVNNPNGPTGSVHPSNPYLSPSANEYNWEDGPNDDEMPFNHGFLESDRIFNGSNIYPGDVYEIRTKITRPNGADNDNGNGTLDIAITTGTLGNSPNYESYQYSSPSSTQTSNNFEQQNGVEVFSTFNSAVKWQMGYGQGVLNTSNFFVMPNIPSTYDGMNIQIGPGNSDIDFSANTSTNYSIVESQELNLLNAYPFKVNGARKIKSTHTIPHNFGTGHPWGMMIPQYNEMALIDASLSGPQPDPSVLYKTWWKGTTDNHPNKPTKFDENVKLEKVELIRYSKNPYMLTGVKSYKVNGDYSVQPNGQITGRELIAQKRLEYNFEQEGMLRNYDYTNGDPLHAEIYQRRVILLTKVREIPVDVVDMYAQNFGVPASDTSKILTTFLGYRKVLDNDDLVNPTINYNDQKPYMGISQYLLYSYVDHLGGITKVDYYPFGGNGESRFANNYFFNPCQTNIERKAFGQNNSYTGHAAVQYLAKNDENDVILTSNSLAVNNSSLKVWEYQYTVSEKIFNPKQMKMSGLHFRSQHLFRNEHAFGAVRVLSPVLPNGEQTHIDYEYYGHIGTDPLNVPSKEDFLLYGKLKSMKTYDQNNVLHEEKIINYDYTLAFQNAYLRPNLMREKLGYDDYYARAYEYEDIYKNEVITMDITNSNGTTSTQVGPATYPSIDVPILNGLGSSKELPKFMEFWFYNELDSVNADYFFDSYFIKKTSEISKVYDNSMEKMGVVIVPVGPANEDSPDNPFGTGVINTVPDDPIADEPLMTLINDPSSTNVLTTLLANSPLSDAVLNTIINSSLKPNDIVTVLATPGGLSNSVWNNFIDNRGKFSSSNYSTMINSQPYFSDAIQSHFIQVLTARDNYAFPKDLLLKNEYLSGSIVLEMTNSANKFPEEVFSQVISAQLNLSESTVLEIIKCVHVSDNTLVDLLSDQVLTDELWDEIFSNPMFKTNTLTQLVENTQAFPSDNTLIDILEFSPAFDNQEIERIFAIMNRPLSTGVEEKLLTNFPEVGPHIALKPFTGNPLDQYCSNAVIEGRTYIETRTDYEYYEADYTGKSIGIAHEMLLGHRSSANDPSPYPFTQTTTTQLNSTISHVVHTLRLKHEPSWQVFSVETSSPQHPNAYSLEEYFYLYDLQNRYDRYWYNYDLQSGDCMITDVDPLNGLYSADTIGYNINWASEYSDPYSPLLPQFDGMERSRTYGNRVLAFQKSVITKNARDENPLIRSEYYDYDRRWVFNDLPNGIETIEHDWGPCPTPNNGNGNNGNDPCNGLYDCTDCYWFKYLYDDQIQALVTLGHCAYSSPTLGWFICPYGTNVSAYAPDATLQYCNVGVSSNNSPLVNPVVVAQPKAQQTADIFAKTLLLRSVTIQVDTLDHSANQTFSGIKMDGKNRYIAEFQLGNTAQTDANNFAAPYKMVYPYDNLTVRTIEERNRYLQPALEENQVGLQTRYYYNTTQALWNTNINCVGTGSGGSQNYLSFLNEDIAKPIRITVGYSKLDSLSTTYEYNDFSMVSKVTEPSGKFMEFEFDNYHRLISQDENGLRHLTDIHYGYWNHDMSSDFEVRTDSNYVQTYTYNEAPSTNPFDLNREVRKAFIDPLGRTHSVASQYSLDGLNHIEIHSGSVSYDNWSRTIVSNKNYQKDLTTTTVGAPKINLDNEFTNPFAETRFENDPKGRALRTSNYDVDVTGIHAVKSKYDIVNNIFASCELDLNVDELEFIMGNGSTAAYKFFRTEILDQDNKKSVEYLNALGQKVANLKYNTNSQKIVTLFVYDSYGNLTKVINPEKQESDYEYNILGQLVKEQTIDAGTKRYMYNKQGLVSVTLDEQGRFYDPNGNGLPGDPSMGNTNAFYRVYNYDDYGRLIKVGRSMDISTYTLDQQYGPLYYETVFIGQAPGEPVNWDYTASGLYLDYSYSNASSQDWLASYETWGSVIGGGGNPNWQVVTVDGLDASFYPTFLEKEFMYGGTLPQSGLGKIKTTYSYNNEGSRVLKTAFTYDSFDNLATQTTTFNSNGNVDVTQEVSSVIEYPSYNYRNSLKEQTVDVNGDGTVDYHCYMEYDALNRLKAIHGAAGYASNIGNATLLVSYEYDDANGLINKKKHFIDDDNGLSVLANEIDYNYDTRDRLTEISAGLPSLAPSKMMHYQLFYDDQLPMYQAGNNVEYVSNTNNWNGNINGTLMQYDLQASNIATPVDDFDKPLLYGYTYDKINRLIGADATVGNFLAATSGDPTDAERRSIGDVSISYDRIGNIKNLHRTIAGADILNSNPVLPLSEIQHWNYNYYGATNRLTGVIGQSGTASRAYSYDANGNLLTDDSKNVDATEYGRAAYPFEILQDQTTLTYLYSENDLRIYKKSLLSPEAGNQWSEDYYLMDAFGKTVAILHKSQSDITGKWEYFASGAERECRLMPDENQTNITFGKVEASFYLYDHLGNTRVTYTPSGFITHPNDPTVCVNEVNSVVDYFPYGKVLRHKDVLDERYLTTQHERDQETDLDYRGARYYDNEVGRFLSLDPRARDYPSLSDYVYVAGNPLAFIDSDGKKFVIPEKAQREQVLGMLNTYSQHTYATNDKGVIYVSEWNTNEYGSEYFSDRMQQAMNSERVTEIVIYEEQKLPAPYSKNGWLVRGALPEMWDGMSPMEQHGKKPYMELEALGEGGTFKGKNNGGAKNNILYISGKSNLSEGSDSNREYNSIVIGYFWSDAARILMHELIGHAIPEMIGSDTGNAIKNENKVIEESNKNKAEEEKEGTRKIIYHAE